MQRIDGFLAVLSITGGNFSPHPQKLPFAVTIVDGDNFLLYYSSIDLGRPGSEGKGSRIRNSSTNGSQTNKGRIRIPMKGRIQLVFCSYPLILRVHVELPYFNECNFRVKEIALKHISALWKKEPILVIVSTLSVAFANLMLKKKLFDIEEFSVPSSVHKLVQTPRTK